MSRCDRQSSFEGALLGLALGDALGAPFEGGILERGLWRFIGTTSEGRMRWTDDTQMALDLAESLVACGAVDQDDIARRFARGYRWSRGYGPGAARILKRIRNGADWRQANTHVFPEGSFGNGGAMRAPVVGLFSSNALDDVMAHARATAVITHAHPLAQECAALVALATALALHDHSPLQIVDALLARAQHEPLRARLATARSWTALEAHSPCEDVREHLGNSIAAAESCMTAIYVALEYLDAPFKDMVAFVAACSGDVDTIGAMAGAIWGARNGASALPSAELARLEDAERLRNVAQALNLASA